MIFAHPAVLWLLVLPLILFVERWIGKKSTIALPLDHSDSRKSRYRSSLAFAASMIPSAILAIAILMIAGPMRSDKPQTERLVTNIDFVLDVSGSMQSNFGTGSRYDAAMEAIRQFAEKRKGDAFGLTIFGNEVLEWTPLTKDLAVINNATPFLRPGKLPHQFGGTEIGKAIEFCSSRVAMRGDGNGDRLLILLSDGISSDLYDDRAAKIGNALKENSIVLHAVHIGDNVPSQLQELVRPTGGSVFGAGDPNTMARVFSHIDQMQRARIVPKESRMIYNYEPLALAGVVLMMAHLVSLLGLRYTPW